jgi:hypothetical protein
MSVQVRKVFPENGGFGKFDVAVDAAVFESFGTVDEYITECRSVTGLREVCEDDPESETLRAADGATRNQGNGRLVGWVDRDGSLQIELVDVVPGAAL